MRDAIIQFATVQPILMVFFSLCLRTLPLARILILSNWEYC